MVKDSKDAGMSWSLLIKVPLKSTINKQVKSNYFGLKAVHFSKSVLKDIADNKYQVS